MRVYLNLLLGIMAKKQTYMKIQQNPLKGSVEYLLKSISTARKSCFLKIPRETFEKNLNSVSCLNIEDFYRAQLYLSKNVIFTNF